MDQEAQQSQQEAQPKRKPGRPRKVRAPEDIDRLRGSAKQYALRTRGEALDKELEILLPLLRDQVQQLPPQDAEGKPGLLAGSYWIIPPWLEEGQIILRNDAYGKTPLDFADEEELEEEGGKSFEDRVYAEAYIDSLACEFARRAKAYHLPSDLVSFVIRVIEAALRHTRNLPGAAFPQREELTKYLDELKADGETYREPVKPKGRPGPKPKQVVVESAGTRAYVTYEFEA
jgi:hypothetical protein